MPSDIKKVDGHGPSVVADVSPETAPVVSPPGEVDSAQASAQLRQVEKGGALSPIATWADNFRLVDELNRRFARHDLMVELTRERIALGHEGILRQIIASQSSALLDLPSDLDDIQFSVATRHWEAMAYLEEHVVPTLGEAPDVLVVGPGYYPLPPELLKDYPRGGFVPSVSELALVLPRNQRNFLRGTMRVIDISHRPLRALHQEPPRLIVPLNKIEGVPSSYLEGLARKGKEIRQAYFSSTENSYLIVTYPPALTKRVRTEQRDMVADSLGASVDLLVATNVLGYSGSLHDETGQFLRDLTFYKMLGTVKMGGYFLVTHPEGVLPAPLVPFLGYRVVKRWKIEGSSSFSFLYQREKASSVLDRVTHQIERAQTMARRGGNSSGGVSSPVGTSSGGRGRHSPPRDHSGADSATDALFNGGVTLSTEATSALGVEAVAL